MEQEPLITTDEQLQAVLNDISFQNTVLNFKWQFHFEATELKPQGRKGWLVWCSFERPDTDSGLVGRGRGRDEIVWQGTTLSGAVKTCWLLVELLIRHELMEGYRWRDSRIFNPHHSVLDLARIQELHAERISRTVSRG
jgi:hypothetical protein